MTHLNPNRYAISSPTELAAHTKPHPGESLKVGRLRICALSEEWDERNVQVETRKKNRGQDNTEQPHRLYWPGHDALIRHIVLSMVDPF